MSYHSKVVTNKGLYSIWESGGKLVLLSGKLCFIIKESTYDNQFQVVSLYFLFLFYLNTTSTLSLIKLIHSWVMSSCFGTERIEATTPQILSDQALHQRKYQKSNQPDFWYGLYPPRLIYLQTSFHIHYCQISHCFGILHCLPPLLLYQVRDKVTIFVHR